MAKNVSVWKDIGQRDATLLYNFRFWSLALLRVFLGGLFAYHGALRLLVPANLAGSVSYFTQVGIPLANYSVYLFGIIEIAFGLFLFFGLFTRLSAFVLMLGMTYIFFQVHLKNGFLVGHNGYEFVLFLVFALLFVLANGSGHLALENMLKGK